MVEKFFLQSEKAELEAEAEATARKKAELQSVNDLLTIQIEDMRKNLPVGLCIAA